MIDLRFQAARAWRARGTLAFILLTCAVPLWYTLYTKHVWEDFFITFRHSQNLCEGNGLVYNPGERVHGFTSPLGVLLPAFCYVAIGSQSYLPALWMFRVLSIAAFCGGGLLVLKCLRRAGLTNPFLLAAFTILYAFESKAVAFSVNGMETGFMLLFMGWGIYLLRRDHPAAWLARGVCWAGLMWTRPDGFVPIAALALADLVFVPERRRQTLVSLGKSAALAAGLYLPWVLWAWSYYGSPVPNTALAKSTHLAGRTELGPLLEMLYVNYPVRAATVFGPIYYPSAWYRPAWVGKACYCLGILCSVYWLFPVRDRLGRMASLGFMTMCIYFSSMMLVFPWYTPPATLLGLVVLVCAGGSLATVPAWAGWPGRLLSAGGLGFVCVETVIVFALTASLMRIQEKDIEMGNRVQIGLWLKGHVRPHETVFLEPSGYIGYFSGATIVDPGLLTPRAVRLIREEHRNMFTLIPDIKPDWAVLRPAEEQRMIALNPYFREHYAPVKRFDVSGRCARHLHLPGSGYMRWDAVFTVFQRKD